MQFFDSLPTPLKHCLYSNNVLQFTYNEYAFTVMYRFYRGASLVFPECFCLFGYKETERPTCYK